MYIYSFYHFLYPFQYFLNDGETLFPGAYIQNCGIERI